MPAPRTTVPLPSPLYLRRLAVALGLVTAALAARADIAVLREKGPHSGSAFSNPGLIANAPAGLKVAMKTADVKIHLRPEKAIRSKPTSPPTSSWRTPHLPSSPASSTSSASPSPA